MCNILVIDDNKSIVKLITAYLKQAGYETFYAYNGKQGLDILDHTPIDLLIVDVMMPEIDGYELTRDIRRVNKAMPILMVTAKERLDDKKEGFSAGVDDYMVKPIDLEEMLLRVQALLRRAQINAEKKINIGQVELQYDQLTVKISNKTIVLPQKEFYLLFLLLSYPGKIFTRFDLMDQIWGYDTESDERTVDVHIKRLREKFQDVQEFEIVTVRGLGYKAVKNNEES